MTFRVSAITLAVGMALAAAAPLSHAGEVEVLHYWTSGGEAKSVEELKKMTKAKGVNWKDFAVEGDSNATAALRARIKAGNAVTAAQMKTPGIQELGREGGLGNLDAVAKKGDWDSLLTPAVAASMKYDGHYVAAPVNVHRENWLWINSEVFAKAGAKVPTTYDEFFEAAEKIKRAGMIAIARGGQPWQDSIMLESVVLGVGGAAFYQKVFAQRDQGAINSPTMVKVFDTLGRMKPYIDKYAEGRDWNMATSMVIHAKGGMQFMGDWAKGEFVAKGKVPGKDFLCVAAPSTENAYIYTVDSLMVFSVKGQDRQEAQTILAETIMSPEFQEVFNLNKGSIPARSGVPRDKFDSCALKSMNDMASSSKSNTLVPSIAMAMGNDTAGVFQTVTAKFMNTNMTSQAAVEQLGKGLRDLTLAKQAKIAD